MSVFTFRYRQELDSKGIPQLGLFAEEVEVNPDLVTGDAKASGCTVRYDAIIAMLINEFFKEHRTVEELNRKIQEQEATITQLKKQMEIVLTRLKEQDSKIQRVGTQLEVSRRIPQSSSSLLPDPGAPMRNPGQKIQQQQASAALQQRQISALTAGL